MEAQDRDRSEDWLVERVELRRDQRKAGRYLSRIRREDVVPGRLIQVVQNRHRLSVLGNISRCS